MWKISDWVILIVKAHSVRPDGRGLLKFRPAIVNVGSVKTADGSSLVKIGNTTVVCGIKAVSTWENLL